MHTDNFKEKPEYSMHFHILGTVQCSHNYYTSGLQPFCLVPLAVSLLGSLCCPFYRKAII